MVVLRKRDTKGKCTTSPAGECPEYGPDAPRRSARIGQYARCHSRTLILLRPFCYLTPYSATNSASRISRIGNLYRVEVS